MLVRSRVGRLVVGVAALLGVAALIAAAAGPLRDLVRRRQFRTALEDLAAARANALPKARFSVAADSPPRVRAGAVQSGPDLETASDAAIAAAGKLPPEERLRASAYVHVVLHKYDVAIRELEESNVGPPLRRPGPPERRSYVGKDDATGWSDLAAARYEAAVASEQNIALLSALTDVDRALKLAPELPAALFNRALIVERIGLAPSAASAWREVLRVQPGSEWAPLVQEHLRALRPVQADAKVMYRSLLDAIGRGDANGVLQIVRSSHKDARAWGEVVVLRDWAKASPDAERWLRVARMIGAALRQATGESLLSDEVAVIDGSDPKRRAELAAAHVLYYDGRLALKRGELAKAETQLRAAEQQFSNAGSPMAQVAACHRTTALIKTARYTEAAQILPLIRERAAPSHRALLAQVDWNLAICDGVQSRWDDAIAAATESTRISHDLGEIGNAAGAEEVLAELYDYLGQHDEAWRHRMAAFPMSSAANDLNRLQALLAGGSRAEVRLKHWDTALSLLKLEAGNARAAANAELTAEVMARKSRVMLQLRDLDSAREAIASGRAACRSMDQALARTILAELDAAEALLVRESDPRHSAELLTSAIAYYRGSQRAIFLPELYLERGRSYVADSDDPAAERDFRAGIDELEAERRNVQDLQARATVLDLGEELFDEYVRLLVRQRRFDDAFQTVERAHARALLDQIDDATAAMTRVVGAEEVRTRLPSGTAVVELYLLPEKLIVFTVDGGGLHTLTRDVKKDDVARLCDALAASMAKRETIEARAGELYDLLFGGVDLAHVNGLVVVPSGVLQRVPFAALYDRRDRRYLIEKVTIAIAPSAAIFVANASRERLLAARPPKSVLAVGNPTLGPASGYADLKAAEMEAKEVALLYPQRKLLVEREATKALFAASAPEFDVIHFAGHALSDEARPANSRLLLAPDGHENGVMHADEIARLELRRVRLVVLAACSTMSGRTAGVEGMPSVARSFLAAGAPDVVATLWDIEDKESARFFTALHRAVATGVPPAKAARDAQLELLHKGKHPAIWAPFELFGGSR